MLIRKVLLGAVLALGIGARACSNSDRSIASPTGGVGSEAATGGAPADTGAGGMPAGGGSALPGPTTVSVDFVPSLAIANETLVFPLTRTPTQRSLSAGNLGELVVAYTRIGCQIIPEEWIGATSQNPVALAATDPVVLTRLTISQQSTTLSATDLAQETCLSLRPAGGEWQAFLQPGEAATDADGSVKFVFTVPDTSADAAAIFLPTYTSISSITYEVR